MWSRRLGSGGQNWRVLFGKAYDSVHTALWAALSAALIFFVIFVVPSLSAIQALSEADRIAKNEQEYDFYCRRLEMSPKTTRYAHCMSELAQFRRSIERQVAEESDFLP